MVLSCEQLSGFVMVLQPSGVSSVLQSDLVVLNYKQSSGVAMVLESSVAINVDVGFSVLVLGE